jgi:hypothetical protein
VAGSGRAAAWDKLDARTQDNVRHWLGGFVGKRTHPNNWILFQVVTEQFLKSVGGPYDDAEIARGLDMIEDWYAGDGWYSDGAGQNFDYYIGWAMHLYPLMWTRIAGPDGDQGRAEVYRSRLSEFLGQYQYFFGADGAPVHQGRSLTYRYAAAAPLWLGELAGGAGAGATPLAPGQARRLASGVVRHFTERGVPDADGLLTLGWYDTFLPVTQRYSGPGSPYWASKAFLGLLLPADHPAWTERERPAPNDEADQTVAMPAPGFLLSSTRHDGIVRLLNHGSDHQPPLSDQPAGEQPAGEQPVSHQPASHQSDNSNKRDASRTRQAAHDDPHYAKLAYSNLTAPSAAEASWRADIDNHIAILTPAYPGRTPDTAGADGEDLIPARRGRIERITVGGRQARSRYRAALPGGDECVVETAAVVRGSWEVRAHRVTGPSRTTVREGGYAVAGISAPRATVSAPSAPSTRNAPGMPNAPDTPGAPVPWACAIAEGGLASLVVGLHGWVAAAVREEAEANAFGPRSAVPYLVSAPRAAAESVYVTLVILTGEGIHPEALSTAVTAQVRGATVLVSFPGETVELQVGGL